MSTELMSTDTIVTGSPAAPAPPAVSAGRRLTFARVVSSEWVKARSLRTTWVSLAATFAVLVGFGLLAALTASGSVSSPDGQGGGGFGGVDPVSTVLSGANLAVLIVSVIGVLVGAREFTSGMIRTSVAAVPSRLSILWAKLLVFLGTVGPVVIVGTVLAFVGGTAILTHAGVASASWGDAGVTRAVLGTAANVLGLGVIGVALGFLFRSVGAAIGTLLGGLLFVPTLATALLPDSWDAVLKYLPSNAAQSFSAVSPSDTLLSPGAGALVFAAWVVVAVGAAAWAFARRDV